ncbi:MAG: ATP-dependent helicase [Desulfobacterota bacterium]|nr:ATP-dependent helicase [Thermodesulfobacteriota bacterium]MDW8001701.1 ATP-dependent helicase [Deltaproteobacteria bacterium]
MEDLNESQRKVCEDSSNNLLVCAGPGTGKTYALTKRIEYLLNSKVEPSSIVAITFTNKAATEIYKRLQRVLRGEISSLFVGTIHRLALKFLEAYTKKEIRVIDRETQIQILKTIVGDEKTAKLEAKRIEKAKNRMVFNPEDSVFEIYERTLRAHDLYDFEDLILKAAEIVKDLSWEPRIEHVLVDEFQDLNRAQYEFISNIVKLHKSVLCAFGDVDQSIYGFRGSDPSILLDFQKDYPDCQVLKLNENHRSTKNIIEASTAFIRNNKMRMDNPLVAKREQGPKIKVACVPNPYAAGDFIVGEIQRRIGGLDQIDAQNVRPLKDRLSLSFSDFAVLYRTNEEASFLKRAFESSKIPYQIIGGRLEGSENGLRELIKLITEALKNDSSLQDLTVRDFFQLLPILRQKNCGLTFLIEELFSSFSLKEVPSFLMTLTREDDYIPHFDAVTLTSLHRAKGLEFSCVFIVGLDEGRIPLRQTDGFDIEEERRLLYVGMTRAKDELFLIHSEDRSPSPFLSEIPDSFVERLRVKKPKKPKMECLFSF